MRSPIAPLVAGLRRLAPSTFVILAVLLVLAASAAALVVVYSTGERLIVQRERAQALAELELFDEVDREQGLANAVVLVARFTRNSANGERYGLFSEAGAPLAGDIVRYEPGFTDADWRVVRLSGRTTSTAHVVTRKLPDGARVVVGRDLSNTRRFGRTVLEGFLSAFIVVAVAGFVIGSILNARMLRRVDAIAQTAERIAAGDLAARTPIADPRDPFGRVGVSLNAMLDRIEALMTGMRTVSDSLAHDLRTPLTRTKGALARALSPDAAEAERLDAIEDAHGQVDQTLAMLSAMLDIARAETGLSRDMMQTVDVAALVDEVTEFFAPIIEDADQTLSEVLPEGPIITLAHPALLRQAIGNLLHNAALYAGEGAEVAVRAEALGDRIEITVADTGQGVAADQLDRISERFVRLDPARASGGSGLGLAIATACAKLHGGALRLEDNSPGLRAVLEISRVDIGA